MGNRIIPLRELPLSNDFMFGEVMRRETVCKLFLEALLGKEIRHIQFIQKQTDLSDSYDYHGIRLDVYLNDNEGTVYNIEMQTTNKDDLERRIRFYQSGIDRTALEKGTYYSELAESYVIFVCSFDYYHKGLAVYERESHIRGLPDIPFDDGSHALILNSNYTTGNANAAILEFLTYIKENDFKVLFASPLMKEVQKAVEAVRNDKEKEVAYMTFAQKMEDVLREGERKGKLEGKLEGRQEGEAKLGLLISKLLAASRLDDATAASTDEDRRNQLYKEFGIQ